LLCRCLFCFWLALPLFVCFCGRIKRGPNHVLVKSDLSTL
jgi:hypothetical protein